MSRPGRTRRRSLDTGVSIDGGFVPGTWARTSDPTTVTGFQQAAVADNKTGITPQSLTLVGTNAAGTGVSSYGLRVINGAKGALDHVTAQAGTATGGGVGANGVAGSPGGKGRRRWRRGQRRQGR